VQNLKVDGVAVDEGNARQSMQTILDTMKGTVAVLDECEILVVGPAGRDGHNECLVTGTARMQERTEDREGSREYF